MNYSDKTREELEIDIINLELEMRMEVKNKNPDAKFLKETFKKMRWMSHSVFSRETLESYYHDLLKAKYQNRNLMIEKYARMDNLIPVLNTNSIINQIVDQEITWMKETSQKYSIAVKSDVDSLAKFAVYEKSELETYSDKTLDLFAKDVFNAARVGRNLVEERYSNLYIKLGFNSIADAERQVCKGEDRQ